MENNNNPFIEIFIDMPLDHYGSNFDFKNCNQKINPTFLDFFNENLLNLIEVINSDVYFFDTEEMYIIERIFPAIINKNALEKNATKLLKFKKLGGITIRTEQEIDDENTKNQEALNEDFIKQANDAFFDEFEGGFHEDML